MEGLLRDAAHVIRIARTLESVHDYDYWHAFPLAGLPVAMSEQPGFRIDLKQPDFGGRDIEPPGHKSRGDGHGVGVFQYSWWLRRLGIRFHGKTAFHEGSAENVKLVVPTRET